MRIAIIFALLFHAAPAAAQQQDDTLRIVAAIRESGCSAHAEDLDRIQSSLGISREVIETIIMGMQNAGEIQIEGDGLRLSPAVCNESATAILPDFALARQINQSEAAMTNHVLALFAANGCELHSDQYQAYIDRKFPESRRDHRIRGGRGTLRDGSHALSHDAAGTSATNRRRGPSAFDGQGLQLAHAPIRFLVVIPR